MIDSEWEVIDYDARDVSDPLRDAFDQLERDVSARMVAEFRAACPHRDVIGVRTSFAPDEWYCAACGERFATKPE